jgi:hypothetical protein
MSRERQLNCRGEYACVRGVGSGCRQIYEYCFAVTQLGGDPLAVGGFNSAVVDNA